MRMKARYTDARYSASLAEVGDPLLEVCLREVRGGTTGAVCLQVRARGDAVKPIRLAEDMTGALVDAPEMGPPVMNRQARRALATSTRQAGDAPLDDTFLAGRIASVG